MRAPCKEHDHGLHEDAWKLRGSSMSSRPHADCLDVAQVQRRLNASASAVDWRAQTPPPRLREARVPVEVQRRHFRSSLEVDGLQTLAPYKWGTGISSEEHAEVAAWPQ
eukprot:1821042-Pleurochrysis_carterae.AAC.2